MYVKTWNHLDTSYKDEGVQLSHTDKERKVLGLGVCLRGRALAQHV
jgi:hypothetical protein